jgi:hypothetical protein
VRGEIDFLKIDAEGWERQVLLGGDWQRFRPRIVLVEAVAASPQAFMAPEHAGPVVPEPAWESWEGVLCGQGYELCYFDGLNRFYVRQEDRGLREAFSFPPNIYDRFESRHLADMRDRLEEVTEAYQRVEREAVRLQGIERERDELAARLQAILSSRSWRSTAPLRWLARRLRPR